MRLINTSTLKLEEFGPQHVPPYAILSHRWIEGQEVSFEEMRGPPPVEKSGYDKIKQCCEQARKDGFTFAWVDTCCIDKSSSAELSESINSMFRWYAMAQVCYAYLEDVPYLGCGSNFIKSAWFTRGWTLQELLSPSRLVFYSAEWHEIGDRAELSDGVSSITGIGQRILCGRHHHRGVLDLSNVSIARRMSWASRRQTSREEDMSYSLLGIFGVSMNLLYGEGGKEAFRRLQEEIIKTSNDNSIFVWTQAEFRNPARLSALATTPLQFAPSSRIPIIRSSPTNLTTLTNEAINMLIYVKEFRSRHYDILKSHGPRSSLDFAIPLEMISPNTYIRLSGQVITLESNRICGAPVYASLVNRVGKYGEDSSRTAHIYSAITFQNIPSRFELLSVGCPTFDKSMGNDFSYRLAYTTDPTWVEILDHDEHRTWIFCIHPGLAGNELTRLWREEWIYSSSSKTDFETAEMWGKRMAEQPIHHRHELGQSIRVRVHALQAMEPRSLFEKIQYYRHIYLKQNPGREKRQQPYPYKDCLFVDVRGKSTASFIEQGMLPQV
ncbi:hypothetical protein PG989_016278 [Apiospora arundinis]